MFLDNPDTMRPEPTPERVLAVCRMAESRHISKAELQDLLTLSATGEKSIAEINSSLDVAMIDLEMLELKDGRLYLTVSPDVIHSASAFRRHVASKVFVRKNSTFILFSKWVIARNDKLAELGNWEGMAVQASKEVSSLSNVVGENAVTGWRFWAAFLGLGYLNGTMLIPNMKIRLEDILAYAFPKDYTYGIPLSAKDFTVWLSGKLSEADCSDGLPLAVSAGLRTLHDLGLIRLETRRDTERVPLFYVDGDPFNEFSHITVMKEVGI